MTTKTDFSPEEWKLVLEAPPGAAMMVITAQRGGMFRETMSMAKFYAEARQHHGESELLDEIVAAKPEVDHKRFATPEEFREHALGNIRDAVALLEAKAEPQELGDYKGFVVGLATRVAEAHSEGGQAIGDAERSVIGQIEAALA
jgi:hypothetical protein